MQEGSGDEARQTRDKPHADVMIDKSEKKKQKKNKKKTSLEAKTVEENVGTIGSHHSVHI